MLETFKQTILGIRDAYQANPLLFSITFGLGLLLIWFKYWLIRRATRSTHKQNYAGWNTKAHRTIRAHPTGIGHQNILTMKPVKTLPIALFCLVFFGGGALFMAETELRGPDPSWKAWFTAIVCSCFSILSLWLIVFSFTRIVFNGEAIERCALFRKPLVLPLSDLQGIRPISKTIAGGVLLEFKGGQRLRVLPRFSGYRELLDLLAQKDPKLAMMLRMVGREMENHLNA